MSESSLEVSLPEIPGRAWHLAIDTAAPEPDDIVAVENQQRIRERQTVEAHSVKVFESR
jgi:hypothetical protein